MNAQMTERAQREFRLTYHQTGLWGTNSTDYFHAVDLVFQESKKVGAGVSRWVLAGLPVLMAGVEAVLIEHQHMLRDNSADTIVAGVDPIHKVLRQYLLPDELSRDILALIEIRNQVIHPAHVPFGRPEWPVSVKHLRDRNVLDGNTPQSGGDVLALLESHRLFEWAVRRCAEVVTIVAETDDRSTVFRGCARNLWRVLRD